MEQIKRKSFFKVLHFSAFVLAAALIMGLLTGCPNRVPKVKVMEKTKINSSDYYEVHHYQQNIENNGYTRVIRDSETKIGKTGEYTKAQAKTYEGFTAKPITQQKIEGVGSTVINVYYDRNIITLMLDLNGGSTSTELETDKDGKKALKGRFGAPVEVTEPVKAGELFTGWNHELPKTFPAVSPAHIYTAFWGTAYTITIKGDERVHVPAELSIKTLSRNWEKIKSIAEQETFLFVNDYYDVYEWRFDDENGEKLTDDYVVKKDITVYAVTNYTKFNIEGNKIKLYPYDYDNKPRGKIIIPDGITEIESGGVFYYCTEITSVRFPSSLVYIGKKAFSTCWGLTSIDLSGCTELTKIDSYAFDDCSGLTSIKLPVNLTEIGEWAFEGCKKLESVDLSGCTKLTKIDSYAFDECSGLTSIKLPISITEIGKRAFAGCKNLESTDLSGFTELTKIGKYAFSGCTNTEVKLPENITEIGLCAFGYGPDTSCKKVLIKSGHNFDRIKQLVIRSNYYEHMIESY